MSEELNAKVDVKRVGIRLFNKVDLSGVYIEDVYGDTLLFAPHLVAEISDLDLRERKIDVTSVILEDPTIRFVKHQGDDKMNLNHFIDYFKRKPVDTIPESKKPIDLKLRTIRIENADFSIHNNNYKEKTSEIDFKHLDFKDLTGTFRDLRFRGDSVLFLAEDLSFKENGGFVVDDLTSNTIISATGMTYDELYIRTPESELNGKVVMAYDSFIDFDSFEEMIRMDLDLERCNIQTADIAHFTASLIGMNKTFDLKGRVKGTVDAFRAKDFTIIYDKQTQFQGNFSFHGLPNVEETIIDVKVKKLRTNGRELFRIPKAPFTRRAFVEVPEELRRLGNISYKGQLTGFGYDFVIDGDLITDIGSISPDLNLKINRDPANSSYSGRIVSREFDIGVFTGKEKWGKISLNVETKGKGFTLESAESSANGKIEALHFNGYDYRNVEIDGDLRAELFKGEILIDDEDLSLDFNGTVDFRGDMPVLDFKASIDNADLRKLNLIKRDSMATLSTIADLQVTGNKIDNLYGTMNFYATRYTEGSKVIILDTMRIRVSEFNNIRFLNVHSDLVDAEVRGIYELTNAWKSMAQMLSRYFPVIDFTGDTVREKQSFDYEITLKESDPVTAIFFPDLRIAANTYLIGKCDNWTDDLTFVLRSNRIDYKNVSADQLSLNSKNIEDNLLINAGLGKVSVKDSAVINDLSIDTRTNRENGVLSFRYTQSDTLTSLMDIKTAINFAREDAPATLKILPSTMIVDGKPWTVNKNNLFYYRKKDMRFEEMKFSSTDQSIELNGFVSDSVHQPLRVDFANYDISLMNTFFSLLNLQVGGIVNGSAQLRNFYSKPNVEAKLLIKDFSLFNDTLGTANISTDWNARSNTVSVNSFIDRGSSKNIQLVGDYTIVKNGEDVMDFDIDVDKMYLQTLGHYVKAVASDIRGLVSGKLKLKGNFSAPVLTGNLNVQKASFLVDYLNARYSFTHSFTFNENFVEFEDLVLNDFKGNQARASGRIIHNKFQDLGFDVTIDAKNMNCLNTNSNQNELFYGTAFGTGKVIINGSLDYLNMDIAMKSEKNTKIFIPLYNPEEIGSSSFVTFINTGVRQKKDRSSAYDLTGLDMVFDFDITPDAEIQLIFDPTIGDIIKGNGSGNIRMEIDPTGKFDMFGDYRIEYGDYLFTLQNAINKKFILEPGGIIRWNGDPYKADIDITANYKTRASLYDLLRDTTGSFRQRVSVDVLLNLQEDLFNPEVAFDIIIPDVDPTIEDRVSAYLDTEQERSEQAFSLLLLNRFATPQELQNRPNFDAGSSVSANASELLSNQLSRWASQISNKFDVDLNYRAGSQVSQEELEVALSTSLFNDRVSIDGNFGVTDNNQTSNLVGEFKVELKASDDGKIRLKAYNKANNNSLVNNLNSQYTQGIGVFYREEFNSVGELFRRLKNKRERKESNKTDLSSNN